ISFMDGYTTIPFRMFAGCDGFVVLTLPQSITTIDDYAFQYCVKLQVLDLGNTETIGDYAFSQCERLSSLSVPQSVTQLGQASFSSCYGLKDVTIPGSVEVIPANAFAWTYNLETVTIKKGVLELMERAFFMSGVQEVFMPAGMLTIGEEAFRSCWKLKTVTIADGVEFIANDAFSNCSALERVIIPASVAAMGGDRPVATFSLARTAAAASSTHQLYQVFQDCTALEEVQIHEDNQVYTDQDGVVFTKDRSTLLFFPAGYPRANYDVPDGVTTIASNAFKNSALTYVSFPESLTTVEYDAFINMGSLTALVFPRGLSTLWNYAFSGLKSLQSVVFQNEGMMIGSESLGGMSADVTVLGAENSSAQAFAQSNGLTFVACHQDTQAMPIGLAVNTLPDTLRYSLGDFLDTTGLQVFLIHSDGSRTNVTSQVEIGELDTATAGQKQVNITYDAFTTAFTCTVEQILHPTITVDHATARPGETVTVGITVADNPGVTDLNLLLTFDNTRLDVVSVEGNSNFNGLTHTVSGTDIILHWADVWGDMNNNANGTVATVTFRVKDACQAEVTQLALSYGEYDILNSLFEQVSFAVVPGSVTVEGRVSGDVNEDGNIDNRDYSLLERYLNDWDVTICEKAADVNRDGEINNKDYSLLQRYLNGWDVTLK
ncbi:MAG: leucine-rich repeat protein, partial [Clostridia bacterium]|nr:leucine-rich repeat protein [Clostridia bacterium]